MTRKQLEQLRRCAENEGGRARLAIGGYANAETAYYFAREAAHYANQIIRAMEQTFNDDWQRARL